MSLRTSLACLALVVAAAAGAANASGAQNVQQVRFKRDYSGGWGKYHRAGYWKTFKNACQPYDGPALSYLVTACKAPDGSYWAVQNWQKDLPLLGFDAW